MDKKKIELYSTHRAGYNFIFISQFLLYLTPLPRRQWIIQINAKQSRNQGQRKLHTVASFHRSLGVQTQKYASSNRSPRREFCAHIYAKYAIHYNWDFNRCAALSLLHVSALFNLCLIGVMQLGKYELLSFDFSGQRVALMAATVQESIVQWECCCSWICALC